MFCGHGLEQAWAYKYDQRTQDTAAGPSGIAVHADLAVVNVNFWVGEPQAEGAARGGLIVHLRDAPLGWGFEQYNTPGPHVDSHLGKGTADVAPNLTVAHCPLSLIYYCLTLSHSVL